MPVLRNICSPWTCYLGRRRGEEGGTGCWHAQAGNRPATQQKGKASSRGEAGQWRRGLALMSGRHPHTTPLLPLTLCLTHLTLPSAYIKMAWHLLVYLLTAKEQENTKSSLEKPKERTRKALRRQDATWKERTEDRADLQSTSRQAFTGNSFWQL